MSIHSLLLSIRPKYAEQIFAGQKTVELRKVKPKVSSGDTVLVYVSSPTKALLGAFEVDRVVEETPHNLWNTVSEAAGITKEEFANYYGGAEKAYGIFIKKSWHLDVPLALSSLKDKWKNFHPPQSYRYVSSKEADILGVL
ncbi:MAG TPA: ASCH domain-containing protein [Methylophilaceae bacterium]|nr:ASCH domain-containing protein [Methylophilaceae bacterium]